MILRSQKWLLTGWMVGLCACGGGGSPVSEEPDPLPSTARTPGAVATADVGEIPDYGATYRQMGLVASGPPISFVGATGFFATRSPDTTLTILSLSFPNRGLSFSHEKGSYEAIYDVSLQLLQNAVELRQIEHTDTVRVNSLDETRRTDESILFRQVLRLRPGEYTVTYTVQDGTSGHEATQTAVMTVPRLTATSISRPVIVYGAPPRLLLTQIPQYLPKPRASAILGIDRSINVYLEAYGTQITTPILCALRDSRDSVVWRDTVWLAQRKELASGMVAIPIVKANIGMLMLSAVRPGTTDTVWAPIFMGFGPDLPAISFSDMVGYLRYFATTDWIHRLRTAAPTSRGAVWSDFLRAIDSSSTAHEALRDYFRRIREANERFRDDPSQGKQGWLSDRGSVFVGLGEPDDEYEQDATGGMMSPLPGGRLHLLVWEYRASQTKIVFSDETGLGEWRLLPASAALFERLLTLRLAG
ncbi:MAG TPA: GWxTD domain-containing protein [Gemmatimonadaceae bacterium]|jgi:GWxTD domain-containing protein|nr:GWxTD domain-containing protein [Gemmatimonadaceae bacterium]